MRRPTIRTEAQPPDEGSASLEFLTAGLILLLPVVYLVVVLATVQSHALGVQATARHVARAIAVAPGAEAADARSTRIAEAIAAEYGIDPGTVDLTVTCPAGGECPRAGEVVTVTARAEVPLPFVPPVLGLDTLATVPVEARAVQRMSRLWGAS